MSRYPHRNFRPPAKDPFALRAIYFIVSFFTILYGMELFFDTALWKTSAYAPAIDLTSGMAHFFNASPLGIWATLMITSGLLTLFIVTERFWKLGVVGTLVGIFSYVYMAYTLFEAGLANKPPLSPDTTVHGSLTHSGIVSASFLAIFAVLYFVIFINTTAKKRNKQRLLANITTKRGI